MGKRVFAAICVALFSGVLLFLMFKPRVLETKFKEYVEISYGDHYSYEFGKLLYGNAFGKEELKPSVYGTVNTNELGSYEVTYKFDNGLEYKQEVKVIDNKKPVIKTDNNILEVCPNGKIKKDIKVTATDNYDGDLTDKVELKKENDNYYVEVKDTSGNTAIEDLNVKIIDDKPIIKLNGKSSISVYLGDKYTEQGAKVTDDCDENLKYTTEGSVDTSKEGTYKLTYKVKDSSNQEVKVERTVTVSKLKKRAASVPRVLTGKKIVYLTFDDGPSKHTARLLDILKKYNVKATFFVTKYGSDAMIKREYDEGHTVALHTWSHDWKMYKSVDTFFADLNKIRDRVVKITGVAPKYMRFAGGSSNTVSRKHDGGTHVMSKLVEEVEKRGYTYFDWNVSSGDAGKTKDTNKVYKNVINGLKSNYSIVLQHDSKGYSVDAVEKIIKYGLANGFTFKAIDDDTPAVHHHVNN